MARRSHFFNICQALKRQPIVKNCDLELCGVTGHSTEVIGLTELCEDQVRYIEFLVVSGISQPAIIGRDILLAERTKIDYKLNTLTWRNVTIP